MGVAFVKSGSFLNTGCIKYSISIFYFTFLRAWGAWGSNSPINTSEGEQRSTKCSWYGIS